MFSGLSLFLEVQKKEKEMKSNLEAIYETLGTILESLSIIPDTQDVTPDSGLAVESESPVARVVFHWLKFWAISYPQVRTERNKARDEAKQLRSSLEAAIKESNIYKKEKSELELQISQLKKEMEKIHSLLMKHAGQFDKSGLEGIDEPERCGRDNDSPDVSSDGLKNVNSEDGLVNKTDRSQSRDSDIEGCMLQEPISKILECEQNG